MHAKVRVLGFVRGDPTQKRNVIPYFNSTGPLHPLYSSFGFNIGFSVSPVFDSQGEVKGYVTSSRRDDPLANVRTTDAFSFVRKKGLSLGRTTRFVSTVVPSDDWNV